MDPPLPPTQKKGSYIFSKESFSYISENGNPQKNFYISGNGTFLYFRKRTPKKLILQEVTFSMLEKFLIFQEELPKPQKPKFIILFQ